MEREERAAQTHVLAIPFPSQGHINPMLQFSKRLASRGIKVTFVVFTDQDVTYREMDLVHVRCMSDGFSEANKAISSFKRFETVTRLNIPEVVMKETKLGYPISCLVCDSLMSWAADIARQFDLALAYLFTQPCGVNSIYHSFHEGKLKSPIEEEVVVIEGILPPLGFHDLPSFLSDLEKYPGAMDKMAGQFLNVTEADWIFFNTFDRLEEEVYEKTFNPFDV